MISHAKMELVEMLKYGIYPSPYPKLNKATSRKNEFFMEMLRRDAMRIKFPFKFDNKKLDEKSAHRVGRKNVNWDGAQKWVDSSWSWFINAVVAAVA